MRIVKNILIFGIATLFICCTINKPKNTSSEHQIKWSENLIGDFSFADKWSYAEGIYLNTYNQLSCDGLCPPRIGAMKDKNGKIIADSLESFYIIVDTSHLYHSLRSTNKMYEYSGTHFINFTEKDNKIIGKTSTNVSTHSSLTIELEKNKFNAFVDLNSIRDLGTHRFPLSKGELEIDSIKYRKGIIKAHFDFEFLNTIDSTKKLLWKGQIISRIEKE